MGRNAADAWIHLALRVEVAARCEIDRASDEVSLV